MNTGRCTWLEESEGRAERFPRLLLLYLTLSISQLTSLSHQPHVTVATLLSPRLLFGLSLMPGNIFISLRHIQKSPPP